jgi:putative DNA primase/helicase
VPGLAPEERRRTLAALAGNIGISLRVAVWRALGELLAGDVAETGRLEIVVAADDAGGGRMVILHRRRDISRHLAQLPLLHLDATISAEIVRTFLPRLTLLAQVRVRAPHQDVILMRGGWGKTSLIPDPKQSGSENVRRERKIALLRDFVAQHAGGRPAAVLTYQVLEPAFAGLPNVRTGHFGALAGIDGLRDVETLFVIGRPLPRSAEVRRLALALFGMPVVAAEPVTETRGVALAASNGAAGVCCRVFGDARLEAVRSAITDAEVTQAIGRGRGVRRTATRPLTVFVFADVAVPLAVRRVASWDGMRPTLIERMAARGVVLRSPTDAAALYPDLFPNEQAARDAWRQDAGAWRGDLGGILLRESLHRGIPPKSPLLRIRYRVTGRGQQGREAWARPDSIARLRAWLMMMHSSLAMFEASDCDSARLITWTDTEQRDCAEVGCRDDARLPFGFPAPPPGAPATGGSQSQTEQGCGSRVGVNLS